MTCIGWDDGEPCTYWSGLHGCGLNDKHAGNHRCHCGATKKRDPKGSHRENWTQMPFDVLERYIHDRYGPDPRINYVSVGGERLCTDGFIAQHIRLDPGTVLRMRRRGHTGQFSTAAERIAEALGVNVTDIWNTKKRDAA